MSENSRSEVLHGLLLRLPNAFLFLVCSWKIHHTTLACCQFFIILTRRAKNSKSRVDFGFDTVNSEREQRNEQIIIRPNSSYYTKSY